MVRLVNEDTPLGVNHLERALGPALLGRSNSLSCRTGALRRARRQRHHRQASRRAALLEGCDRREPSGRSDGAGQRDATESRRRGVGLVYTTLDYFSV